MQEAFSQILSTGVVGAFLVIVIIYHLRTVRELKTEMKEKSIAHAKQMSFKDQKIQELNDQKREDALQNMSLFNEVNKSLTELVIELKVRNNAK